ncbi:MAG: TfpX/TfpZ family type IV pilin accessory protein, partial [Pseudomonadota bacterium]
MHLADSAALAPRASWTPRVRAGLLHLGLSLLVAALAALLVFGLWYPYPYRETSGGRELFQLLVAVDVVVGPLITLVIFDPRKPWRVMRRDLAVVGLVQLAALGYGLWTVYAARPVHLVFEYHRFQVVHAIDIPPASLQQAPAALQALPITGPTPLSLRPFKDNSEMMEATTQAMAGLPQAAMPRLWRGYADARDEVLRAAKPLAELKARFPAQTPLIDATITATGRPQDALAFVPMIDRQQYWTVLVDHRSADV